MKKPLEPRTYNVLFVTIDSCRYDTARKAKTVFLDSVATLKKGETLASYTLPAHISFFIGILPILKNHSKYYLPGVEQIWRSCHAKERNKKVLINFSDKTIIDYYIDNGYIVLGAGGVSFFNSSKNNILPSLFPKFLYFERPSSVSSKENLPRHRLQFPLANIGEIVSNLNNKDPFFLFINCPETHIPYDSPFVAVDDKYKDAVKHFYSIDKIKHRLINDRENLSGKEIKILMSAQKKSLEWIDSRIKELIGRIPDNSLPTLMIVLADHGDEFGEGGRYGHAHFHESVTTVPVWCTIIKNDGKD